MQPLEDEVREAISSYSALASYYNALAGKHGTQTALNEAVETIVLERREARGQKAARERAEAQVRELEAARDTLLSELEWAKRNRDKRIKELEAQRSVAKEALEKLRDLLPEFGGLDGRVWRIIDEALAALEGEGGGQDV